MKLEREMEIARMRAHEERMRRPVKELFPRDAGKFKEITCRNCKKTFRWYPSTPRLRAFCTGECKLEYYGRKGPLPAMPAGGRERAGDATP